MFVSIVGPGTRVSDDYFLTDHICDADRQRARQQQASEAAESGMQTKAASALGDLGSRRMNDKEHEFQILQAITNLSAAKKGLSHSPSTHLDTRKHICGGCGVAWDHGWQGIYGLWGNF